MKKQVKIAAIIALSCAVLAVGGGISSDPNTATEVATVAEDGTVTAREKGIAIITASLEEDEKGAACQVIVSEQVEAKKEGTAVITMTAGELSAVCSVLVTADSGVDSSENAVKMKEEKLDSVIQNKGNSIHEIQPSILPTKENM